MRREEWSWNPEQQQYKGVDQKAVGDVDEQIDQVITEDVKAVDVEAWLKTVPLARGSKAKIRNIMSGLRVVSGSVGRASCGRFVR